MRILNLVMCRQTLRNNARPVGNFKDSKILLTRFKKKDID